MLLRVNELEEILLCSVEYMIVIYRKITMNKNDLI